MEKEMKRNEQELAGNEKVKAGAVEAQGLSSVEKIVDAQEVKTSEKLYLEREKFVASNNKEYWSYIMRGEVLTPKGKRPIRADFKPKDKGGYEVLDIIFEIDDKIELIIVEETLVNELTNKKTKYLTYTAKAFYAGVPFECSLKPQEDSDKAFALMIINSKGGLR